MSEPVSKAEIEDVLSSIRRLVSENANAIRREPDEAKGTDKLVLTPAFRVDGEDGAEEPDVSTAADDVTDAAQDAASALPATAEDEPHVEPTSEPAAAVDEPEARPLSPLEQRIAELEAVVARSAAEFEPDGSETEDMIPDNFVFHHHVLEPASAGAPAAEPAAESEAVEATELEAAKPEAEEPVATEPEGVEAVATMAGESISEWPPEAVASPPNEAIGGDVAHNEADELAEAESHQEPQEVQDGATPGDMLHEDAASHEDAADAAPAYSDMDDTPPAGDGFGSGDDWEEVSAAEFDEDDGETLLDEDTLREMVARMVREELQGAVGERITHNVRRMVRREIARALSLQDFE